MTCAAETPSASASRRNGRPSAIAGCAIIRASWPPPMTASVGADTRTGYRRGRRRGPARCAVRRSEDGDGAELETEPLAAHGGDQVRVAAVVADLAADPAQVDVDGLRGGPEPRRPDVLHELVAADDGARVGDELVEEVVLLARHLHLLLATPHTAGLGVDSDVLNLDHKQNV